MFYSNNNNDINNIGVTMVEGQVRPTKTAAVEVDGSFRLF